MLLGRVHIYQCELFLRPVLLVAPFLIILVNFPLIQSMCCSESEKTHGGSISYLMRCSILPFEIWPKRQCHNFDEVSSNRLRLCELSYTFITGLSSREM